MKGITILGSTGSIGVSTLDVLALHSDRFKVIALTANNNVDKLLAQCLAHKPAYAVMADVLAAERLREKLATSQCGTEVLAGNKGLEKVASLAEVDSVMAAIVGGAGLLPTLAAARAGKRVLLANKEALVMSGALFMDEIERNGATLLPIDSEHNAIFQCLPDHDKIANTGKGIKKILLTGSGGPFRTYPVDQLHQVTPDEACAHPNWDMGRKISVDSATMMNKGLELIEACWLFDITPDRVQIVLHPQSIIHSMVEYDDGSIVSQMGNPDMRIPIAHALAWPEQRMASGVDSLDLFAMGDLSFERPDFDRFPCLRLAINAAKQGGTAPTTLNAANEVAVQAFLDGRIAFTDIAIINESCCDAITSQAASSIGVILAVDKTSREMANKLITEMKVAVS